MKPQLLNLTLVYLGGNVSTHDGVEGDINGRIGLARTRVYFSTRKK